MQRYFWDYCMSQHGYFHVEKSASQCKITMEHGPFGPIPHAWAGERERAEARDAALSELMESDEVRPRLRLYISVLSFIHLADHLNLCCILCRMA